MTVDTQHDWIYVTELGVLMKESNEKKNENGLRKQLRGVHTVRYGAYLLSFPVL